MKASGILGGIGARRTRMRRWAGLAAAPPLDSRLTFAILPPILRLAPLRPETGEAACVVRSSLANWPRRGSTDFAIPSNIPPPSLPSSRFFIHAGEKNGSNRSIFQEGNKKGIGRRGKNETIVSRVYLFVRRCRIYNSDNGLADELLKQTNGGRIEQLARNGIPVFFLSLNAQELTRFPPTLFLFPCLRERGMRQTNHTTVHADYLYYVTLGNTDRVSASSIVGFFHAFSCDQKQGMEKERKRKKGKKDK